MSQDSEQESIELTGTLTNRLLRYGVSHKLDYEKEAEVLDALFSGLKLNEAAVKGFEAMPAFIPAVPGEILNRYEAMKSEVHSAGLAKLVIGACGLSPLGIVLASQNPSLTVYETDLPDVVNYRKSLQLLVTQNYQLHEWDLLNAKFLPLFMNPTSKKVGFVVEGLTFYLDAEQRHLFNLNLQRAARQISPNRPVTFIFDYYISSRSAEDREKQKDMVVLPEMPEWQYFKQLFSNVFDGQKAFFKSREEVKKYLKSGGFTHIRVSPLSRDSNAHTVFVCEYGGE